MLEPRAATRSLGPVTHAVITFVIAAMLVVGFGLPAGSGAQLTDAGTADLLGPGTPKYQFKAPEKCLMKKINAARAARGMRRLEWDRQLGYVARRHANSLASNRGLWHDSRLGSKVTRWRRLGQNTGRGGRCPRLFDSFMASAPHRSNIFGRWRFQGVGSEWSGGVLYVQHVFEARRNPGNIYRWP